MKSNEIWKVKESLSTIKSNEDFWHDDSNANLWDTPDTIKIIEYFGNDLWRVLPITSDEDIKVLQQSSKKKNKLHIKLGIKLIIQERPIIMHGDIIYKHYTKAADSAEGYGPQPMYMMENRE
jgi:hypothetical protein